MTDNFEKIVDTYANAVIESHSKYGSKRYCEKTKDCVSEILKCVFIVLNDKNPSTMMKINNFEFADISDSDCVKFKKVKNAVKTNKNINMYTGIFIPAIRKIVQPILQEYDVNEPSVRYNRITSINSIASKIYKNFTDPENSYTDTFVYDSTLEVSSKRGGIIATCKKPISRSTIDEYKLIIEEMRLDKEYIEQELSKYDENDEEYKNIKNELIDKIINTKSTYKNIEKYVIDFIGKYKTALHDMSVDKPLTKAKTTVKNKETVEHDALQNKSNDELLESFNNMLNDDNDECNVDLEMDNDDKIDFEKVNSIFKDICENQDNDSEYEPEEPVKKPVAKKPAAKKTVKKPATEKKTRAKKTK